LNISHVHLLPLRDRKEDIPILIRHYIQEFSASRDNRLTETNEVWECLLNYDWPGNVRELKNVLQSDFVNCAGNKISICDLPCEFRKRCSQSTSTCPSERQALLSALLQTKWNKSRAAEQLSWSRMTLYRKMRKYRIASCSDQRIA
jgi:DNA-binding NtrC family response regulator